MIKTLAAPIRGYLPSDYPHDVYQSPTDNFHCTEMLSVPCRVRDAREDLHRSSTSSLLEQSGFTLASGRRVEYGQADFQAKTFRDACEVVESLLPSTMHTLFAQSQYMTLRRSQEGGVVPCLHADYSRSAEEYWRTLACFTSLDNANAWQERFACADVRAYQVFNVWRVLQPDYDDFMPLGMVSRESVVSRDIVLGREALPGSPDGQLSNFLRLRYSADHDWCYFSSMRDDEMIVFQSFSLDKDPSVPVTAGCFHAAVDNSEASFRRPSRISCEYRIGVFLS